MRKVTTFLSCLLLGLTLQSCGSSGSGHEIMRFQSEQWWNSIRAAMDLPENDGKWMAFGVLLLAVVGAGLLTSTRLSMAKGAVALLMGLLELFNFLSYPGDPAWFLGDDMPWLLSLVVMGLLIFTLFVQLLVTDQATLPDSVQDIERVKKDDMFVALYFVFMMLVFVVLLYVSGKFMGWESITSILNWCFLLVMGAGAVWLMSSNERQGVLMVVPVVVSFAGIAATIAYCSWTGAIVLLGALGIFSMKIESSEKAQFIQKAEAGDPESMVKVARMIRKGEITGRPISDAVSFYQKAMDKGYAPAFNGMGIMYREGKGVPCNPQKALQLCKKSYDMGNLRACLQIGSLYADEKYGMLNTYEAWNWFLKGGQGGDFPCMLKVAYALKEGKGVLIDKYTALVWAEKAANHPEDVHGDGAYLAASIARDLYDKKKARYWIEIARKKEQPLAIKYYNLYIN